MARPETGFMKGWTHTRVEEPLALTPSDTELSVQSKPEEGAHLWDMADERGEKDHERSAGNYGRRQFRSNQREIWRGLGPGLIGAGTWLCIHLSMRGLHWQSSLSWPNQSHLLTTTSSTSITSAYLNPVFLASPGFHIYSPKEEELKTK